MIKYFDYKKFIQCIKYVFVCSKNLFIVLFKYLFILTSIICMYHLFANESLSLSFFIDNYYMTYISIYNIFLILISLLVIFNYFINKSFFSITNYILTSFIIAWAFSQPANLIFYNLWISFLFIIGIQIMYYFFRCLIFHQYFNPPHLYSLDSLNSWQTVKISSLNENKGINSFNMFDYNKNKNPDSIKSACYHEAGHAVLILLYCPENIQNISFDFNNDYLATTSHITNYTSKNIYLNEIKICYGGYIAENIYYKLHNLDDSSIGAKGDLIQANNLINELVINFGYNTKYENVNLSSIQNINEFSYEIASAKISLAKELQKQASSDIEQYWELVQLIYEKLYESECGKLKREEILNIFNEYKIKKEN